MAQAASNSLVCTAVFSIGKLGGIQAHTVWLKNAMSYFLILYPSSPQVATNSVLFEIAFQVAMKLLTLCCNASKSWFLLFAAVSINVGENLNRKEVAKRFMLIAGNLTGLRVYRTS